MKTYKYRLYGDTDEVAVEKTTYKYNNHLAVLLNTVINGAVTEPYACITANLPESAVLPEDTQFVDENNMPGIGRWLKENGIAVETPIVTQSGFCQYRAYRFLI